MHFQEMLPMIGRGWHDSVASTCALCVSRFVVLAINRGKVAFANPGAVLRYYNSQTFLATFRSDLDLLRANNNWDTEHNARYK